MKRSFKRVIAFGMALACIMGATGCSIVDKIMGNDEMEYGLVGKPVDENNTLFILNEGYSREGYTIDSPVFLVSDDTLAIAYTSENETLLALYNYVDGKAEKEVKLEVGYALTASGDNGNVLLKKETESKVTYCVYNNSLSKVCDSAELNDATAMIMSANGENLIYSDSEGTTVNSYSVADKKSEKICDLDGEGYKVDSAQIFASKVSSDASSMIITVNVLQPSFETHTYLYTKEAKVNKEFTIENSDIEVMGNKYIAYDNTNSGDNHIRVYDVDGLVNNEYKEMMVEISDEMANSMYDEEAGYMITSIINPKDSDYPSTLHVRCYSMEDGLVKQSALASAENIFTVIGTEKAYDGDNAISWFSGVASSDRTSIDISSDKSQAILSIKDAKGVRVLVWKLDVTENEDKDKKETK